MEMLFNNYIVFLAVFARMAGMILFNPIFGRNSIPMISKMGLCLFLSMILMGILPEGAVVLADNMLTFLLVCSKELLVGFFVGFIMQLFLSALMLAGDFVDLQLGVGMAKIYDPQSNVSMSLMGSVFNLFYMVLFFVTNGHLTFFKIIFYSFEILPLGTVFINPQSGQYGMLLFESILILALKLALPVIAVEIVSEMSLGMLMRAVPQINVFVVGLQLKLLVGLIMIVVIFSGFFGFFNFLNETMFKSIQAGLQQMA